MFQTNIHHFLQQFDHAWWTILMQTVSDLGTRNFYLLVVLVVMFSIEYRKGFLAVQALMWANFFTIWLKDWLNMPRPYHVDADLKIFELNTEEVRLTGASAKSFFGSIDSVALEQIRAGAEIDNGIPSGHTSTAVSFFGTMALSFRRNWLTIICLSFIILTIISRMYLGMHFLADILAGLSLGLIPILIIYFLLFRNGGLALWKAYEIIQNKLWVIVLFAPLLLLLLPQTATATVGQIIGLNLGVWATSRKGFPNSGAVWWKRLLRFIVAVLMFILITSVTSRLIPKSDAMAFVVIRNIVEFGLFFSLATWVSLKMKLFEGRVG